MVYRVVHELKQRLAPGCVPVFSSDGLKHYFYALTAHFGRWEKSEQKKKAVWVLLGEFMFAQVIPFAQQTQHQNRRKTVEVERRMLCGNEPQYRQRLLSAGLSGRINTAFVERLNLTLRQGVSRLTRRTWGPAHFTTELIEHLEWFRAYYHFARFHESLSLLLPSLNPAKDANSPDSTTTATQPWRRARSASSVCLKLVRIPFAGPTPPKRLR
jgi:IS1 family transposase